MLRILCLGCCGVSGWFWSGDFDWVLGLDIFMCSGYLGEYDRLSSSCARRQAGGDEEHARRFQRSGPATLACGVFFVCVCVVREGTSRAMICM